ncbi:hypothetical protein [Halotia branconii]|uniref:Uncharacterized protein n=1 Tax=Halotia branconii CENA392 TaxID=1539056 RepID=A0AAJ6NTR0_9CYAN|nr:hypothetical protein [Halotia branconii]WGV26319.1 hypothetical protein QI031_02050 [Halotia branconii CENA392]
MPTDLNLDHLKEVYEKLNNTIKFLSEEAGKARDDGRITAEEWQKEQSEWGKLETKALELQGLIDKSEISTILNKDINSSYSQILYATDNLKKSAEEIDNVGNVISEIAKVFDVVNSTINAIKSI